MLKSLLVDVDSVYNNIALEKAATYEESIGNEIVFKRCNIPIFPKKQKTVVIDCTGIDRLWVSAIFEGTFKNVKFENTRDLKFTRYGGTGIDVKSKLPSEVEACQRKRSLYPVTKVGYTFISRGCPNQCEHCVVPAKEGALMHVEYKESVKELLFFPTMKFFDNNFLALADHKAILKELIEWGGQCQFNQGLDISRIDDESAELLSKLNYIGEYIFAFDHLEDQKDIEAKLPIVKKYITGNWKLKFFIYCHPNMDIVSDVYYRILWCKEHKVLPYFMRHISCWGSENERTYNDFSAWCNQPGIFKTHTYEEFCRKRRPQKGRIDVYPNWFRNLAEVKS